ncbi:hypothetical protein CPSG_04168 [Coccidioides posadasii str. Silveira]|uniref:Uncharacterized protein n=1 Tax=Coccidioides posadasii (strain RMSCC 757 / Silveira) TaxID=443226 RepID=E9D1W0_COCPS|nr:hypothetical protein CPSG_04168 [Coccidioides posadasii str. Silveira]
MHDPNFEYLTANPKAIQVYNRKSMSIRQWEHFVKNAYICRCASAVRCTELHMFSMDSWILWFVICVNTRSNSFWHGPSMFAVTKHIGSRLWALFDESPGAERGGGKVKLINRGPMKGTKIGSRIS